MAMMRKRNDHGFTMVELLVVAVIIGILAAIAVPIYLGQRAKAHDAAAEQDLNSLAKHIVAAWGESAATPTVTSDGDTYEVNGDTVSGVSAGVEFVTFTATDNETWCVAVRSPVGEATVTGYQFTPAAGFEIGAC